MEPTPNPYAAPAARVDDLAPDRPGDEDTFVPEGQSVPSGNAWTWITGGFDLFKRNPLIWIVMLVIVFVLFMVLGFIPILGIAVNLLYPILVGGLMLGCDALRHGEPLQVGHLFAGFKEKAGTLAGVGLLYLLGLIAVLLLAALVVFAFWGSVIFQQGMDPAASLAANFGIVVIIGLIALAAIVPLAMAVWFAPALVVFHDMAAFEAMKASFRGCLKNILPFLVYGILAFLLAIVATIPFGLGWLIWWPTLVASVYCSYRDIYLQAS